MAYGNLDFFSESLKRVTSIKYILPNEKDSAKSDKMKLLILLHGYNGNNSDWILNSLICQLAERFHTCVIMPSGENSFYLDRPETGAKYATFVGEELPLYIRKTFSVTTEKAKTWIGGFSMGGFGALHTALQFPENFGKVFALSSALIVEEVINMKPGSNNGVANYEYFSSVFGEPKMLEHSVNNPKELVRNLVKNKSTIPEILMACGTEDFLLAQNRDFDKFLTENNVPHQYFESKGNHNFEFWNEYLEVSMKWFAEGVK